MVEEGHGDFPKPLHIGPKTIRWRLVDVEEYLGALAAR
jgi:predicted DNA-binding transcriptional regulator AlpA